MKACTKAWIGCVLLAAFGCGDDDSAAGPSVSELPAVLSKALCHEVEACFDQRTLHSLFGDDGCDKRLLAQIKDGEFANLDAAIDAGRVTYAPGQVAGCLDAIKGLKCDFSTKRVFHARACDAVFEGKVEPGDDCGVDADCKGKAFCQLGDRCPGTCTELQHAGSPCTADDECTDGLACAADVCTTPAAVDESCNGGVAEDCKPGLFCVGEDADTGKAGTCRSYADVFVNKLDESCDYDTGKLCTEGLSCIVKSIQGTKPNLSCAKPVAAGASCRFGIPSQCPEEEYCDALIALGQAEGKCMPLPAAGEACVAIIGSPACAPGLVCGLGRCHPISRLGQPCTGDDECASKICRAGRCQSPEACKV